MTSTFYFQLMLAALSDGTWAGWAVFALLCVAPAILMVAAVYALVSWRMRRAMGRA